MTSPSRDRSRNSHMDRDRDNHGHRHNSRSKSRERRRQTRDHTYRSRSREFDRYRDSDYSRDKYRDSMDFKRSPRSITPLLERSQSPIQSKYTSNSHTKHAPLTAETLKERKLAALDQQKYLCDRQKDREAAVLDKESRNILWPSTPPHREFYMGSVSFEETESEPETAVNEETTLSHTSNSPNDIEPAEDVINDDDIDQFGPSLRVKAPSASSRQTTINSFSSKPSNYGGDLMPGEGSAMASFVASGQRIPRRGEIGLESDQITRFESAGFVMSGSRHHLMNAVRMRKENQVISTEEKKMISQMALEERIKREEEIVKTFKSMVDEKFKNSTSRSSSSK